MPYRHDLDALAAKRTDLERELEGLRTRRRAIADLDRAETDIERELATVEGQMEKRARQRSLLSSIRVASPCSADWASMTGDDRVRLCATCDKQVYNLSEMTEAQAAETVFAKEGQLCVRFYRRKDGTMLTADCPVGRRRVRLKRVAQVAAGGLLAMGGIGYWLRIASPGVMGAMAVPPPRALDRAPAEERLMQCMGDCAIEETHDGRPAEPPPAGQAQPPIAPGFATPPGAVR